MDVARRRADSGVAELLGRDDELAQLYNLIDVIGQRGGALVVRGEAGIGKSALLEAAAVRARERDVPVASVSGMPSEARFAFAGLQQLLLPFLESRDRLPQPQRRALETAIGLADGDAPDPFLVGLACGVRELGLVGAAPVLIRRVVRPRPVVSEVLVLVLVVLLPRSSAPAAARGAAVSIRAVQGARDCGAPPRARCAPSSGCSA